MFKFDVAIRLAGALFLATLVAGGKAKCLDCVADSLTNAIDQYDQVRSCWFQKHKNFLIKEKFYTMEALVTALAHAIKINNDLVKDECKHVVELETCSMDDKENMSECPMRSLRVLNGLHRKQEQCYGRSFQTDEMRIAARLIMGNIIGWRVFHPEC